jgi:hypothetical protein
VLEVRSREEALRLNDWLCEFPGAVGLDTETTGWSPDDGVSPVGRAKIFCVTLAWGSEHTPCFIPREFLPHLRGWLESDRPQKVGTNLWGFDRHVFANEGIRLDGILADTVVLSRLVDSRPELDEHGGHGLEAWGARIGHNKAGQFKSLVTVTRTETVPGKVEEYKRVTLSRGVLKGGERQAVRFVTKAVQLGLDEAWEQHPERRQEIRHYACTDPVVSLKVYERLKKQAEGRRW